jgi:hypothetical protein
MKLILGLCAFLLVFWWGHSMAEAGNPYSAYYHWSGSRLFWILIISDTHVGTSGVQDTDYLSWAVNEARNVIDPLFIVNTGDLTDSTNGGLIPNGPYREEWEQYRQILDTAGMDASVYYDIPGNHDHYNDRNFAYYLAYSIQGSADGATQHAWMREFAFGTYHFLGVCTAGNDGAAFSIWPWDNYGDHAGLDSSELDFIATELANHPDVDLTMIFGHHPFDAQYHTATDTGLTYGRDALLSLIEGGGVSLYGFGHTHNYRENIYHEDLFTGVFYMNVASLGKSAEDHFAVLGVDGNGVSIVKGNKGAWPVVLITAPVDIDLGETSQPFAYEIPQGRANPVRALVFDPNPVTSVVFCIDDNAVCREMVPSADGRLWQGFWDATGAGNDLHTIEVWAYGTGVGTDAIQTVINPTLCMGDGDRDGDVDGTDLAKFISDYADPVITDVAASFGRINCWL